MPPEAIDRMHERGDSPGVAVALAREAAASFPNMRVLIAASLGPYGAALHNGAEYHGNYTCTFNDLVEFHRERIQMISWYWHFVDAVWVVVFTVVYVIGR